MASAIKFNFSFPPKSNAFINKNNNNLNQNTKCINNVVGLSRSSSSSLVNAESTNFSNCNYVNSVTDNSVQPRTPTAFCMGNNNVYKVNNNLHAGSATPRDGNCSFTFDELKNTLSFMDDSPLVNANKMIKNSSNLINVQNNSQLTVEPTTQTIEASSLSSSSTSSANSYTSSSSCASCCNSGLSKSNSANQINLVTCTCVNNNTTLKNNNLSPSKSNGILDCLLIKKSPLNENQAKEFISSSTSSNSISSNQHGVANYNNSNTHLNSNHLLQAATSLVMNNAIENAAKQYRCAAQSSEASCSWKGKLPPKQYKTPVVYSTKVFVGGLPWDITEEDLVKEFGQFGSCHVEWTNKEKNNLSNGNDNNSHPNNYHNQNNQMRNYRSMGNVNQNNKNNDPLNASKQRSSPGFAYVIFDNEYSVRSLVGSCIEDYANGRDRVEYFFKISTKRVRNKEVQIIPWILADNNFALCTPKELDAKKTVFVGNLHGTMTARDLAHIMNELFGCVVYAGIDIDKLKYPIGSGRVTFSHQQNFMRSVRAAFVDIQAAKFSKRIQIDPYLEDIQCCVCSGEKGVYFCRDFECYDYYCGSCWQKHHSNESMANHKPLMRKREEKF